MMSEKFAIWLLLVGYAIICVGLYLLSPWLVFVLSGGGLCVLALLKLREIWDD
jgi:hypothetical protein